MFKKTIETFANCFKIPELKSRILFTMGVLAICRVVAMIPIPGIDMQALKDFSESIAKSTSADGGLLNMYSMFTGGALEQCAVGSLGIMPYISATIIIQLLTAVIPQLSKLAREEGGRTKLVHYGRVLTVLLCLGQGFFMALGFQNASNIIPGYEGKLVLNPGALFVIQATLMLTTGTMLLMWFGEQITERGIGNGVSLVITIGILARLPQAMQGVWDMFVTQREQNSPFLGIALLILLVVVIAGVIAVTQGQRKVPIQYAQRAVGRKVFQGGSSFMPLRVNYAGVMPIIFASAVLMVPAQLAGAIEKNLAEGLLKQACQAVSIHLAPTAVTYIVVYALMILFFSYFWVATQFNELQIADDLKKNGGYIPGVRPGQATSDFLHYSMSRITLAGAVFLTLIAVVPIVLSDKLKIPPDVGQFFGGTSLLITVGVMLDTMRQMETHLLMRHYDGFLKKGRLKGRF